ncbi:MAG TPA: DUF4189 domain-containing protein [Rhizomicrobium sp.]|jgi:hypothetical protein|nr:DUF4189 domain-containing protein [Rhizomicrobium sp.]
MTNRQKLALVLGACMALAGTTTEAAAFGALVIGQPTDIGKDGFAMGYSYNQPSLDVAENTAMQKCLGFQDASADVRALCTLVMPFSHRCLSIAFDPQVDTYGLGWAISDTQDAADEEAMARCRSTSTADRAQFCEFRAQQCDVGTGSQ